jgi:hypothetical protein
MQFTKRKKITAGLATLAVIGGIALSACGGNNAQPTENSEQQADSQSLITNQPLPHYNFSQIRQTLIDAEDETADTTQTTTFFMQQGDPNPINSCPSVGFPVASNAELSNPDQVVGAPNNSSATIGQEDPNGIYSSPSTSGTYVICTENGGQHYLEYWEGNVYTVGGPAVWNDTTHAASVVGAPSAPVQVGASQSIQYNKTAGAQAEG